jgi:protein-S-isoprenylcysteine O-methyltransferase Ste14
MNLSPAFRRAMPYLVLTKAPMNALELIIPPPLLALLVGVGMWGLALHTPEVLLPTIARLAGAATVALVGGAFSLAGLVAFRRAKTTVNPMKPEFASSLVSGGVYRFTRNPMYVGLLFVLIGWAIFLAAPWSLLGPCFFVVYIGRFQIEPEERVLARMFGSEFVSYQGRVRRWL